MSLTHCAAQSVWDLPAERLRARLRAGEREFLRGLPVTDDRVAEALRLGPGASYCLAQHFAALGLGEIVEQLLAQEARRGRSPWREEAALELAGRMLARQDYAGAEALSRELGQDERAQRVRIEALYWQERDREALQLLQARRQASAPWDAELDLFEAVLRCRLEEPGWQEGFTELFLRRRASPLHLRAYGFLQQRGALQAFPPALAALFQAKDLMYRGRSAEAIELLEPALLELPAEAFDGTVLVDEVGAACFAAPAPGRCAALLLQRSASLEAQARLDCREMAGRLLRRLGSPEAVGLLEEVRRDSRQPAQRDRAAWFLLDMARDGGRLLEELARQSPAQSWHSPSYFGDILDQEITRLTARRAWGQLLRLRELLPPGQPAAVRSRLEYILARAAALRLLAPGSLDPQALLAAAGSLDPEGYHGLLASAWLDERPLQTPGGEPARAAPGAAPARAAEVGEAEPGIELVRGLLDFGLHDAALRRALGSADLLPRGFLLETARTLSDRGLHAASIRLAAAADREGSDRDRQELLFPRAFAGEIDAVAGAEDLPAQLLYALVREESLFDPAAVSAAGAVGLTQLMQEAAADAARRLGLQSYDLRDPAQNLRLGGRHLGRLLARLEDVPKALMAYNAGLSRLRGWERSFAGLPTDLLVEALPFPETQGYVRKLFVSTLRYGSLYFDLTARQCAAGFFPQLPAEEPHP